MANEFSNITKRALSPFFYVQDERYSAMAWMPKSAYVRMNGIAQWQAGFCSRQILSTYIHVGKAKERICSG